MKEPTKQLGLRIPSIQYNQLQDYAKANEISLTELIISIFNDFLDTNTPGLCQKCHTQNNPDARYCQSCGEPLTDEARKEIYEVERLIEQSGIIEEIRQMVREKLGVTGEDPTTPATTHGKRGEGEEEGSEEGKDQGTYHDDTETYQK